MVKFGAAYAEASAGQFCGSKIGGEGGIRTLETLLTPTRVPGVRIQPLCHLSRELLVDLRVQKLASEI